MARNRIVSLPSGAFIDPNLPLLEFTKNLFPSLNLEKVGIICAQHIVSTTRTLFHHFFSLGLKPSNLYVIGKCYSTNPHILSQLQNEEVDVCPSSVAFVPDISYDQQYKENLHRFINAHFDRLKYFERLVVIDDGGTLLSTLHNSSIHKSHILGIEQTSAGYHHLKKMPLQFPVINVARSTAKLNHETPFIVDQLIDITFRKIESLFLNPKKILILGNGAIGRALRDRLTEKYKVVVYDTCLSRSDIGQHELQKVLSSIDLIFGCTGYTSLPHSLHRSLKKDVVLASGSSSDREFDSVYIRQWANGPVNCHTDINVNEVHLLNCGFPVNFDSDFDAIDIPNFQLTRSLLLAAALQLLTSSTKPGLNDLGQEIQNQIIRSYLELYPAITVLRERRGSAKL